MWFPHGPLVGLDNCSTIRLGLLRGYPLGMLPECLGQSCWLFFPASRVSAIRLGILGGYPLGVLPEHLCQSRWLPFSCIEVIRYSVGLVFVVLFAGYPAWYSGVAGPASLTLPISKSCFDILFFCLCGFRIALSWGLRGSLMR